MNISAEFQSNELNFTIDKRVLIGHSHENNDETTVLK